MSSMVRRLIVALVTVFVAVSGVFAKTTSFNKTGGGSWTDPANWDSGIPGADDDATLPAFGGPYTVVLSSSTTVKSLKFGGGSVCATLALKSADVKVSVTDLSMFCGAIVSDKGGCEVSVGGRAAFSGPVVLRSINAKMSGMKWHHIRCR